MPQPIYLPRQPTFMEQFLGTGVMDNIMRSIMMGVQNRREDEKTIRGYQEEGYTEIHPRSEYQQQMAGPQTAAERAAFAKGPSAQEWGLKDPDVSVGTGRGVGPFHSPKRGFSKPVEPTELSQGKPYEMNVGGKPIRVVPWYDKIGNLKNLTHLGEAYERRGSEAGETEKREKQLNAKGQTIERTYRVKNGKRIKGSEGDWRIIKNKPQPTNVIYGTVPGTGEIIVGPSKGPIDLKTVKPPGGKGIAPKTLGRLSEEQQKSITDLGDIERISIAVNELVNPKEGATPEQLATAKGLKWWMGPISGRARTFASGWKADPHWVKLKTRASKLRTIIYGLSGKMINATEDKWLKEDILPALSEPGPNFEVKLKELEDWARAKQKSSIKAFRSQGYIVGDTTQPTQAHGQSLATQETVPPNGRKPLSSF